MILIFSKLSFQYNISWHQNKISWCYSETYHNFERIEDRAIVFLKWTDFSWQKIYCPDLLFFAHTKQYISFVLNSSITRPETIVFSLWLRTAITIAIFQKLGSVKNSFNCIWCSTILEKLKINKQKCDRKSSQFI